MARPGAAAAGGVIYYRVSTQNDPGCMAGSGASGAIWVIIWGIGIIHF